MTEIVGENDQRLSFCDIELYSSPPSGIIEHIKDHYWICHPERGLVMFSVGPLKDRCWKPQANKDRQIAEQFLKFYPWAEIRFVSTFFRKVDPRDYVDHYA